jgi:hypothetical protein
MRLAKSVQRQSVPDQCAPKQSSWDPPLYDTSLGRYVPERCVPPLLISTMITILNLTRRGQLNPTGRHAYAYAYKKCSVLSFWSGSGSGHIIQGNIVYGLHHTRDARMFQGTFTVDTSLGVTMSWLRCVHCKQA